MTLRPIHTTAAAWIGYVVVFPLLHGTAVNDMTAVLLLVPLLTTAWHFGRLGGVVGALLVPPVQITLFLLADHHPGWDMVAGIEGAAGLSGICITAVLAGAVIHRLRGAERAIGEKERLVATVSHEVRNPLTGVIGLADTLLEQWDEMGADEARELVALIGAEAHTMEAIVEDLLDFSRLSAGAIRLDMTELDLGRVTRTVEPEARGDARVIADEGRVTQIVRNLTTNAVRYGGDTIQVESGVCSDAGWVEVRDDGPGIDIEIEPRLFTPFASSSLPGSTGLGLAVSRELARAMGGDLLYTRRGRWTVFRLDLPLAPKASSGNGHRVGLRSRRSPTE